MGYNNLIFVLLVALATGNRFLFLILCFVLLFNISKVQARVGNSLIGFLSKSLVFVSKRAN